MFTIAGSIPDLTTSHQILRNSRTHLPPPRSRSPKKTALGSSPRRQSSMAPRASSVNASSPTRAASHPIARRLDFEHDDSSLQETPALSGSGARRGKRAHVYDIPEGSSPTRQTSAVLEESYVQEEITANEESALINGIGEESFVSQIGDDTTTGAEADAVEDLVELEESEVAPEPVKQPAKRGRKRKSDALEPAQKEDMLAANPRKRGVTSAQASETQKKSKKSAPAPAPRRSQRVSDITEQEPSILDATGESEEAPVAPKRRGRPARVQPEAEKENAAPTKAAKQVSTKEKAETVFKKPPKPATKTKGKTEPKDKAEPKSKEKTPSADAVEAGKLVDVYGNPLSKKDIEQMSTTSVNSRFGRGRHLSVFREMDPEAVARVGRTGRHRVAPIDFWRNDRISYDVDGSMTSIVKNQDPEEPAKKQRSSGTKGKKRTLTAIEEDVELDPWEEEEGILVGNYRDFDPVTDVTSNDIIEDSKLQSICSIL